MPVLDITEKSEKIFLPSTKTRKQRDSNGDVVNGPDGKPLLEDVPESEQAFVVMDTSPFCAADTKSVEEEMKSGEIGIVALAGRIQDWNYTDAQGNLIPITPQTVGKLNAEDYGHLMSFLGGEEGLSEAQKKASSATSSPAGTANTQ